MTTKTPPVLVADAYRAARGGFAVYGKHCFCARPEPVSDTEPVAAIRLTRSGWTAVSTIGQARAALATFLDLYSQAGMRFRDLPGGHGLVANAQGLLTHLVNVNRAEAITYLGVTGGVVTDKPATVSLLSPTADLLDEGFWTPDSELDSFALVCGSWYLAKTPGVRWARPT